MEIKRVVTVLSGLLLFGTLAGCVQSPSNTGSSSPEVVLVHGTVENRMDETIHAYPRFWFGEDFDENAQSFDAKDKFSCSPSWQDQHPDVEQWSNDWRVGPNGSFSDSCRILYPEKSTEFTLELSWSKQSDSETEDHTIRDFPLKDDSSFQVRYIIEEDGGVSVELEKRSWEGLRD